MNILITGVHGFVGSNLVKTLKENHTIYGLDIISPQNDGVLQTFGWNELDSLPAIDAVIHLAGKAHDTKNQTVAQTYFDINTGLTQKIYDWFLNSSASKFIFFSSVKAAADKVEGVLTEKIDPTPLGPYGESKIAAEKYILSQQVTNIGQSKYITDVKQTMTYLEILNNVEMLNIVTQQKKTYILRPCMIHGPGNKGNLNLLYNVVKKGIPYPLGAFDNRRSFCSIDNLSFVVSRLIITDVESGIYNVCDDESLSTNKLIEIISNTLGKKSHIFRFNIKLIEMLAKAGTLLNLPLNTERLYKLTENYVVSNEKLKKAFEIKKMPVSAMEGFEKTIKSFEKK